MGNKKDYSKFSERFKKSEKQEVKNDPIEEIKEEMVEEILNNVEEQIDNPIVPIVEEDDAKIVTGTVANCDKLNIREKPSKDSKVLRIVNKDEELGVFPTQIDGFYKVVKMETEGYCMAKFIKLK